MQSTGRKTNSNLYNRFFDTWQPSIDVTFFAKTLFVNNYITTRNVFVKGHPEYFLFA